MKTLLRFFLSECYLSNNDIESDWYGELCLNKIEDNGYVVIPRIGDTVVLDYDCIPDYSIIHKDNAQEIEEFITDVIGDCRRFFVADVEHVLNLESNYVDVFLYPEDEDDEDTEDCDDRCENGPQCLDCEFADECLLDAEEENKLSHLSREHNQFFDYSKQENRNNTDVETLY